MTKPSWAEGAEHDGLALRGIDALRHLGYNRRVSDGITWYFKRVSSLIDRAIFYAEHKPSGKEFEFKILNPYARADCRFLVVDAQTGKKYGSEGFHEH